jgi:steroid delta-isomerase-like uncharacterized protein
MFVKHAPSLLPTVNRRAAVQAGVAGLALAGLPAGGAAAQGTPVSAELLQQWATGWSNLAGPDALLALVTDNIVYEDVAAGDLVEGIAGFERLLAEAHAGIPDFTITLDTAILGEGHAAAEYQISGTQSGHLPYLSASGKPFLLRAASIFVLDGDKIQRESRYYNMLSFLAQLGELAGDVLPPLGTPAAEPPA